MDTFRRERSRASAIRRAALCEFPDGKRHPHQYLIPQRLLELAEERLQAAARRLAGARDFDALHEIVKREIGSVHGIGNLMVYDIAHRIGAYLGKAPTLVYLHRGTKGRCCGPGAPRRNARSGSAAFRVLTTNTR
jgi:hypothetical protein